MATEIKTPTEEAPYLLWKGPEAWIAKDPETNVADQGENPSEAIENLREALEGHLKAVEEGKDRNPPVPDAPWFE